jgi:Protein of unknown function (DUF3040)
MMSLPARQQRVLHRIECALKASEPHMAAMFATFTRLTRDDGPATTERLAKGRLRLPAGLRAFVLLPLVFAMLITGAVLGGTAHGATGCGGRPVSYPSGRAACDRPVSPVSQASTTKTAKPASPELPLISRSFNTQLPGVLQMRGDGGSVGDRASRP